MTTTTNNTNNNTVHHYYRKTEPPPSLLASIHEEIGDAITIKSIHTEDCFNVLFSSTSTNDNNSAVEEAVVKERLEWLLAETFDKASLQYEKSFLTADDDGTSWIVEYGPRMTFTSAFSSNAVSICAACGLGQVQRLERSRRYGFVVEKGDVTDAIKTSIMNRLHDRMTEQLYATPLTTFDVEQEPHPVKTIPIIEEGSAALEKINQSMGLGFDDHDIQYYTDLFKEKLGRNPTDVECFDMGQSNSEHSRHWFFSGKMVIDGETKPKTLFQMVKATLTGDNSVIAFHDNSSAIKGYECKSLRPLSIEKAGPVVIDEQLLHPILTAETHNFPSGVAPFPGAETGTGGRLRDVMATGQGAYTVAGVAAYCVGSLHIPHYTLPWEEEENKSEAFVYPDNLAPPLQIIVEASDGASDYGNKYGEPVIHGFTRSFGLRLPASAEKSSQGERYEWVKPIMFSAGIGQLDGRHVTKGEPEPDMLIVKIGGPAYRIGIGGGAASSRISTEDEAEAAAASAKLDYDAVQRGDAEMGNKLNRFVRACCDLGDANPIISIHDQGAGGNGNVLKEIVEPAGASYDIRKVYVGDETLSVMEIWGAEYQENNAFLIKPATRHLCEQISRRENCPLRILGHVTGDGRVVVNDSSASGGDDKDESSNGGGDKAYDYRRTPVDLPLELVLGKMPQKTFIDEHDTKTALQPFRLPDDNITVAQALDRVLRLLSVGSKRFLVNKVDRSVTGLIAQQQCVGPLQLPLSNVGVTAHTHFNTTGTAVACGEQPIKGLVDSRAMARMTVVEALTNLMWAKISSIDDIKASGNWMYAAKLPGEGSKMYDACEALCDMLTKLGVSIDGGKDSLSMAAKCGTEIVKAPGELTLTCYVTCPDITKTVTPDLKCPGESGSRLLYIDLSQGHTRLGGTSLAHVFKQIGHESPDVAADNDDVIAMIKQAINTTQQFMDQRLILAGHDRSDGGLIVTLCEMSFAGNCSIDVTLPLGTSSDHFELLFNEEAGFVVEVASEHVDKVVNAYRQSGVPVTDIGTVSSAASTGGDETIKISIRDDSTAEPTVAIDEKMTVLRDVWEATSFQLEKRQRNPQCVQQEEVGLKSRKAPQWNLSYTPALTPTTLLTKTNKPKIAIIRQEGSNGDREMISAFLSAGFETWDVTTHDLVSGQQSLDDFRGIVFVGGFSYADVLDSGKGWAGVIKFNQDVYQQFERFRQRPDTFSLGVCNGCQLMTLLGWVPGGDQGDGALLPEEQQPRLLHNESAKFESRFVNVKILSSPAIMFKGMEESSLGVWIAHGEGRFHFPDTTVRDDVVMKQQLAPLRYVTDENEITESYPFNPNGSPAGIAALCSSDGRHLAMMPHPERCFLTWQWPWMPKDWMMDSKTCPTKTNLKAGPWLQMFQNARAFCDEATS